MGLTRQQGWGSAPPPQFHPPHQGRACLHHYAGIFHAFKHAVRIVIILAATFIDERALANTSADG